MYHLEFLKDWKGKKKTLIRTCYEGWVIMKKTKEALNQITNTVQGIQKNKLVKHLNILILDWMIHYLDHD